LIALDSSVLIAAIMTWHTEHVPASAAVGKALASREGVVIPAHALLEAYSVMTRLPPPHRAGCAEVVAVLRKNFSSVAIAPFPVSGLWELLDDLAAEDLGGGITYDAAILAAAESAGATTLLTLNSRHFERFGSEMTIATP
jgi:predicted nucleic acid-binding protein